ncbi:Rv3235 family protein, partial [Micrococcus luteus]
RAPASAPRPVGARVCEVAPGRVEASATVLWEGRARAFALRLERRLSRWKVTSVEIG